MVLDIRYPSQDMPALFPPFPRSSGLPHRHRGLSLVESLVALAILAIAVGAALPAFTALAESRHLQGVAQHFEADVMFARSASELRSQTVRLSFFDDAAAARCWLVHTGEPENCRCDAASGSASCEAPALLLRANPLAAGLPLRLSANAPSLRFSAARHTVTPAATVTLSTRGGRSVQEVVSVVGRVRGCSPGGEVPGFANC
jgi:type IV fimbrial biogenesis protein FimT